MSAPAPASSNRHAAWHVVRRLRGRLGGADTTHAQAAAAQRNIKAAIVLLDWLTARGLTLATARQGDLEARLASAPHPRQTDADEASWRMQMVTATGS